MHIEVIYRIAHAITTGICDLIADLREAQEDQAIIKECNDSKWAGGTLACDETLRAPAV